MNFKRNSSFLQFLAASFAASLFLHAATVSAQTATPAEATKLTPTPMAAPAADSGSLAPLAWLDGCWAGSVNGRDFREHWTPLRGDMMVGMGHTVTEGKTQDYEFLRLEVRPDGVFYVALPSGEKETKFKFAGSKAADGDTEFTFTNTVDAFPQRIVYRRATLGWLYATVEGKLNGEDRKVIYPFRRVDCETGEKILK